MSALAQGAGPGGNTILWIVLLIAIVVVVVIFMVIAQFFTLWLQAFMARASVTFWSLIGMKLRKVDSRQIVQSKIMAVQAGLDEVTTEMLESHYLAGGRVPNVVRAMIAAHRAQIPLDWSKAAAIDLAGRDVLDAVQTSVNPKVIDVPNAAAGRQTIDAVAKDGIQLRVKARVTVRTNIQQLIGGATEETIIARVGEGIVTSIGSADTYKHVMENPDSISKTVLHKGLDAGTAFEILSIDIADIDVGENVGAKLQADQAESDKRRFQAEAEKRRALAIAQEQENKALAQLNRADVIKAEAQIPLAMAEAFRSGHLGIMDYYRMKNIQADTSMRESLGTTPTDEAVNKQ
ncbi:MAG TPA: flotillin-like protein FloA [Phycisphaerae bacterium]|nr:flotillin-like protein FloA [Phycisphaerae bacterium]